MLQLSHINLHFDFKNSLQCIYLIINVIFTLLENIFMNFKVFLLIFDISIFIKKYPPIYLRYIRYIHKMQVPIYPSKPIFSTLVMGTSFFSIQNMCIYSVLYRLYIFILEMNKISSSAMFCSWYHSLSFSKILFCPSFIIGTFLMQPS